MRKIRIILALTFLIFMQAMLWAQDKILLKSGDVIQATMKEVGKKEIKYKLQDNLNGPVYVLKKNKVVKVVYANGKVDNFMVLGSTIAFNHNALSYHILDVAYNDFKINYEHINKNGKLGITLPIAIGFNTHDSGPHDYINLAYSGIGLNYYPTGQHETTYFIGPELDIGSAKDYSYYYWYDPNQQDQDNRYAYLRFIVNNGLRYYPVVNFRVSVLAGIGIRYLDLGKNKHDEGFSATAYITFTMGYLF